jgi:Predicted sugar kinase
MTYALDDGWGMDMEVLHPALARADALVVGPGMGRAPEAARALGAILGRRDRLPSVIDADALALLAVHPELLRLVQEWDILTPHPGEAGMLLGMSAATVQADRLAAWSKLTALAPCVWVLKGAGSLIGRAGGPVSLCPLAAPNLAVGGSGDVLAGSLAALLAQGLNAEMAACLGVYRHARAGQFLAEAFPLRGNSATEIADALPRV